MGTIVRCACACGYEERVMCGATIADSARGVAWWAARCATCRRVVKATLAGRAQGFQPVNNNRRR